MKYVALFFFTFISFSASSQELFPVSSTHSSTQEIVPIEITDAEGNKMNLVDYLRNDRNYVISIWATWCGPCVKELNALQKVQEKWSIEFDTEILALSIDKPMDQTKIFSLAKSKGWDIPVFHDAMAYTSRELSVFGIPQSFVVNMDGEIVYRTKGFKSNLTLKIEQELKKL